MMDFRAEKRIYPTHAAEYDLHEEIGHGANAVVYRAICKRFNSIVAIKCLDLEVYDSNLENVSKEAQVMSLIDHPNVIRAYCSFVVDHFLWVVMPYMDGGSCLHIMKVAHPDGLEENVIATILKETLKALDYLHRQGHIHRDVKAGNVLIDANGCVKLGDFGVSAYLFSGDRQRSRKTFTGTPCWMAPEVMEQKRGYDYRADIWSFGITALELAHGHAPFSKFPPMKVLLMTIQSPPPSLDHERDKRFTKAFKEMLALCLQKDSSKRPTAERLLKHSFFKQAKSNNYIVQKLLNGLGPLWEREKILRFKDADLLAQKKTAYLEEEEISRNEYKRGVSCWNFDVETLQEQAASMQDVALVGSMRSENAITRSSFGKDGDQSSRSSPGFSSPVNSSRQNLNPVQPLTLDTHQLGPRRWSSVKEPKQIGRFGVFDGDLELESPGWQEIVRQIKYTEDQEEGNKLPTIAEDRAAKSMTDMSSISGEKDDASFDEKDIERGQLKTAAMEPAEIAPFTEVQMPDSAGTGHSLFRSPLASNGSAEENNDGGSLLEKSGSNTLLIDNRVLEASVQSSASSDSVGFDSSSLPISFLVPQLKSLLFQTAKQYETVASVIKAVSPAEDLNVPLDSNQNSTHGEGFDPTVISMQSFNLDLVQDLQNKITSLTNEVASLKLRNVQLERQLNAIYNKQEEEMIRREEAEKGYL